MLGDLDIFTDERDWEDDDYYHCPNPECYYEADHSEWDYDGDTNVLSCPICGQTIELGE